MLRADEKENRERELQRDLSAATKRVAAVEGSVDSLRRALHQTIKERGHWKDLAAEYRVDRAGANQETA